MTAVLRTWVELQYNGTMITQDIAPDLLGFSYTDNEPGKADDISITLKNDHGKWSGPWLPVLGDRLTATIKQAGRGAGADLPCGTFQIDEIDLQGPPSTVTIKGVSIPLGGSIRRLVKSRAWESVRLSEIASDVATNGQLSLLYMVDDPQFDRCDQREESDLAFLKRMCKAESYALKVTDRQLVVYDPLKMGEQDPIATFTLGTSAIKGWRMTAQSHDLYQSCRVEYADPKSGQVIAYTYTDPDVPEGRTKKIVQRASSLAEAERRAKAGLYEANRRASTGNLTVVGDTRLWSGACVQLAGFGGLSGKYMIDKVTHEVGSGYTASMDLSVVRGGSDA